MGGQVGGWKEEERVGFSQTKIWSLISFLKPSHWAVCVLKSFLQHRHLKPELKKGSSCSWHAGTRIDYFSVSPHSGESSASACTFQITSPAGGGGPFTAAASCVTRRAVPCGCVMRYEEGRSLRLCHALRGGPFPAAVSCVTRRAVPCGCVMHYEEGRSLWLCHALRGGPFPAAVPCIMRRAVPCGCVMRYEEGRSLQLCHAL